MLRTLIEEALLFALPFVAFAAWLAITKRNPLDTTHWSGRKFVLTAVGLLLAIASVILVGLWEEPHRGAYEPPRYEDGRLVPGRFRD